MEQENAVSVLIGSDIYKQAFCHDVGEMCGF